MSANLYSAIFCSSKHAKVLKFCFVLNGITQFYLPPTRFIPTRAEQDLEHYIRNELLYVAAHFADLERKEASVEPSVPGFEPRISVTMREGNT